MTSEIRIGRDLGNRFFDRLYLALVEVAAGNVVEGVTDHRRDVLDDEATLLGEERRDLGSACWR